MIEVTFKFKDETQFHNFLDKAGVETYTWTKGKITVDLSNEVSTAMKEVAKTEEAAPSVENW